LRRDSGMSVTQPQGVVSFLPPGETPQQPLIHVSGLHPRVSEAMLEDIFSVAGAVVNVQFLAGREGARAALVRYADLRSAGAAMRILSQRQVFEQQLRLKWANLIPHAGAGHSPAGGPTESAPGRPQSEPYENLSLSPRVEQHRSLSFMASNTTTATTTNSSQSSGLLAPGPSAFVSGEASPSSAPTTAPTEGETASVGHQVFVGDLSRDVNDAALANAFASFASLSEARVMWDAASGKSRGYGFLAFRERHDAEQAIAVMNGELLGSRAIRVNWANEKAAPVQAAPGDSPSAMQPSSSGGMGMPPTAGASSGPPLSYETVFAAAPPTNATIYVGNLAPNTSASDLSILFAAYGQVLEIRMQSDRGFAFLKLDTHENATHAIVGLGGHPLHGRLIKTGWGKDRQDAAMRRAGAPAAASAPMLQPPQLQQQQSQQQQQEHYMMPQQMYGVMHPVHYGFSVYPSAMDMGSMQPMHPQSAMQGAVQGASSQMGLAQPAQQQQPQQQAMYGYPPASAAQQSPHQQPQQHRQHQPRPW